MRVFWSFTTIVTRLVWTSNGRESVKQGFSWFHFSWSSKPSSMYEKGFIIFLNKTEDNHGCSRGGAIDMNDRLVQKRFAIPSIRWQILKKYCNFCIGIYPSKFKNYLCLVTQHKKCVYPSIRKYTDHSKTAPLSILLELAHLWSYHKTSVLHVAFSWYQTYFENVLPRYANWSLLLLEV